MTNAVSAYWPHSYYQGGITLVGIVIVSHSQKLAEGVKELAEMMANNVHIEAAGGLDEGLLGTSYERVKVAIEDVCGTDGAVVLMDMGSAVMTAELAVESSARTRPCASWTAQSPRAPCSRLSLRRAGQALTKLCAGRNHLAIWKRSSGRESVTNSI